MNHGYAANEFPSADEFVIVLLNAIWLGGAA
jgi:hypothetical protein